MAAQVVDKSWQAVKRFILLLLVAFLLILFILWKAENQRIERFRIALIDRLIPNVSFFLAPIDKATKMLLDFQSYATMYSQNQELKRQLQQMKGWKEAALQLEQKNSQLRVLNNLKINPSLSWITGEVIADSGSPFNQSGLLNIGNRDGVVDGSAAIDGFGLVGRVSGVGSKTSRVLFLSDLSSAIPATIQPIGQHALVLGDNSLNPVLDFIENVKTVQAGFRVVTSGAGGVLPPNLLIGTVAVDGAGDLRVLLAADFGELNFLRVLIANQRENLTEPGNIIKKN